MELYLAMTEDDAFYFAEQELIEAKFFGTTRGTAHVTFHKKKEDAVLEALTAAYGESLDVGKMVKWKFLKIYLTAENYADMHVAGLFELQSYKRQSYRFWCDIDLKTTEHVFCEGSCCVDITHWAAKFVHCRYKRSEALACSGCGRHNDEHLWMGTYDDAANSYCVHCWHDYWCNRSGDQKGRVDGWNKRRAECAAKAVEKAAKVVEKEEQEVVFDMWPTVVTAAKAVEKAAKAVQKAAKVEKDLH